MRCLRRLYAELAYLVEVTWLEGRMISLTPQETRRRLAAIEARRARRLR